MHRIPVRHLALALLVVTAVAPLRADGPTGAALALPAAGTGVEAARLCTQQFFAGELAAIVQRMTPEMRDRVKGLDGLTAFRAGVAGQLGAELELIEERSEASGEVTVHHRVARFTGATVQITWAFDKAGAIAGFSVRPQAGDRPMEHPSRYADYQTKTRLRLPFDGEWTVINGGRTLATNPHARLRSQRFALDLVELRDGKSSNGAGRGLADYYIWSAPVLAPAAGTVVAAVDEFPDQSIGTTDAQNPAGNHVAIDHGGGEYSFLAHLQQGSVAVKKGDRVVAGQQLGLVGNSGNTSEPHLHYHLQDGPVFPDAESMPASFDSYLANGVAVEKGEPQKGERIRAQPAAQAQP